MQDRGEYHRAGAEGCRDGDAGQVKDTMLLPKVTDMMLALGRKGNPKKIINGTRICFMWAPCEWYLGTVKNETTTKDWWNVEWDDRTKNQLLLAKSNVDVWFVLVSMRDYFP